MNVAPPVYLGFREALRPSMHRYAEHVTSRAEDGFTKQPTNFPAHFNQFGKLCPLQLEDSKMLWGTKRQCSKNISKSFICWDVIAVKSSLKLTSFLLNRNLYIWGNICGFLFYMANKIEMAHSANGAVCEYPVCFRNIYIPVYMGHL